MLLNRRVLSMGLLFLLFFSVLAGAFINVGEPSTPDRSGSDAYATILSPQSWTYVTNPVNLTIHGGSHYWGINRIEYKIGANWVTLYEYSGLDGPHSVTENVSLNLSRGVHTIHARVTAFAFYDLYYQTFAVDIVPPYIAVLSPENKTYNPKEIPLIFETPELSESSNLRYVLDGEQPVSVFENSSLKGLSDGVHNLILYGTSVFGTEDTDFTSDRVYFEVDSMAPKVMVFSIENKTYDVPEVSLNFTVDKETSWLGYSLDGQSNVTVVENLTLSGLSYGLHELMVYANDTIGNMGVSDTIYFRVDSPFTTPIIVASVLTVTAICIGLLVYYRKRKH